MANSKKYNDLRTACQAAYEAGETDIAGLAAEYKVKPATVQRWIRKGGWKTRREQEADLEKQIEAQTQIAYLNALKAYNKNPEDVNLQHLVGLLKNFRKAQEPAKELLDYILRFLDQLTDYLIDNGLEKLNDQLKPHIEPLAEYLRKRNGN